MKRIVALMAVLLLASAFAFAGSNDGYFAQLASGSAVTVPGGAAGSPGPAVDVVSLNIPAGSYLLTASVTGQGYGTNSGAICFFTGPTHATQFGYQTVNTSSDWTHLKVLTVVMLGKYVSPTDAVVTITCQRGYAFTDPSQFYGTLMVAEFKALHP